LFGLLLLLLLLLLIEREKLLLGYRHMKAELMKQSIPTSIYAPPNEIYRRFGYGMCLRKLLKQNAQVHQLLFLGCWFMCDFFDDFIEQLEVHPQLNSIIFDNATSSSSFHDTQASIAPAPAPSASSMSLETNAQSTLAFSAPPSGIHGGSGGASSTPAAAVHSSFSGSMHCDDLARVARTVPQTITSMSFMGNLSAFGILAVLDAVASNPRIESLSLSYNSFGTTKPMHQSELLTQSAIMVNRSATLRRLVWRVQNQDRSSRCKIATFIRDY
jgi:hypothetical protein